MSARLAAACSIFQPSCGEEKGPDRTAPPLSNHTTRRKADGGGKRACTGAKNKKKWRIPAERSLYSEEGTFYHKLMECPGALCDRNGYIVFRTEKDYRNTKGVQVGARTNVSTGISKLDGYIK